MINYPPAKINIGLYVTEKRTDGYHNIETLFYPVGLHDALEAVMSETFAFSTSGLPIEGSGEDNLVVKAYELLKKRYGLPPVKIHLHKNIPMGAGLGGGSSDGAHMLMLLNDLFLLNMGNTELAAQASLLGSDCPFFIFGKPAFATGRGEILEPAAVSLQGFHLVMVYPPIHISTAEAYGHMTPTDYLPALREAAKLPVEQWKENVANQFETFAFQKHPELAKIKQILYENGAVFSLMTGSGSAVYGLFRSPKPEIQKFFPGAYHVINVKV